MTDAVRTCLNCQAELSGTARFCPACSQRTDTGRLSLRDMTRDLMHAFVNVERGPVAFARALLMRPGEVARDHVDGRRRRHYGPFATLAVMVGLAALVLNATGYQLLPREGVLAGPAQWLHRHFNLVLLVQLPLLGGLCALLFREARLTLIEHMVLVAYTLAVRAAALTLSVPFVLLQESREAASWQPLVFWAAWYAYFGWAASQFYPGGRWSAALRGAVVAALGHALIVGLLVVGSRTYVEIFGA